MRIGNKKPGERLSTHLATSPRKASARFAICCPTSVLRLPRFEYDVLNTPAVYHRYDIPSNTRQTLKVEARKGKTQLGREAAPRLSNERLSFPMETQQLLDQVRLRLRSATSDKTASGLLNLRTFILAHCPEHVRYRFST